jgi:uncharacterized protein (TIGR02145 family)/uncharacterized repeat protein (TIGR02543 family)
MKKTSLTLIVLMLLMAYYGFSQRPTIELTFTAQYQSQPVILDSIYIQNLSQSGDTTLYAPNTVLLLDYILGIIDFEESEKSTFSVSPGYPNPSADGTTKFKVRIPEKEFIKLRIVDLFGREVASYENTLEMGTHSFTFLAGREKYYVLTVAYRNEIRSIKILNSGSGGQLQGKLVYSGNSETLMPLKSHSTTNGFGYDLGDHLRFIGYANTIEGVNGSDVIEATPIESEEFLFDIVQGIPCAGTPNVFYEGQYYKTVQIGAQCWLKENLNVGTMINGTQEMTNNGIIEKYCYENLESNCDLYGSLYQWEEMMSYSATPGVQGICPEGWHLPTDAEWTVLTVYLGSESVAGGKMKSTRTWPDPHPRWNSTNTGATNSSGWSGLPGGDRYFNGNFNHLSNSGLWWSSTMISTATAWYRYLNYNGAGAGRGDFDMALGFSVRCVRDYTPPTTYNLSLEVSPGGTGTVTGAGQYEAGELVSITAEANTGWDFVNWTDDDGIVSEGANFTYTMPAEDITLTANFVEEQVGFNCGDTLIDSRDGQSYTTVLIGDQCWMAENLNIGTMINGYQEMTNNGIIEKYCYNNLESNCDLYGSLYQWDEMMSYTTTPGVQGICPEGWHVPTYNEWTVLTDYLGGENVAGGKMKSTRTEPDPHPRWNSPNTGATNSSSWSGLPGGYRSTYGDFSYLGNSGYWWSSTEAFSWDAWECGLICHSANAIRGVFNKELGIIVRCVWDYTQPTTYNLNLEVSPAGAGTVTGAGQYEAGEEVNLTAEANTGWEFVNWTDDDGIVSEAANFTYTMPEEDVTLTANFVEEQTGFTCGDPLVDSRDGQSYITVLIGDQCWMAENLNIGTRINGNSNQTNNGIIEKYCYNNDDAYCDLYGGLYQWREMMGYSTAPTIQGICPEGWHLPTDAEWCTLEQEVDPTITCSSTFWRGVDGGGKLKETGTIHWSSPNTGATNSSGFTGLPGGYRYTDGNFDDTGDLGYWWSSTETSPTNAWIRALIHDYALVSRDDLNKGFGFSVRCLKDN